MIHVHLPLGTITKISLWGAVLGLMWVQPYRPVGIVGRSMEPTYANHSYVWTLPTKPSELKRGEVVVIRHDGGLIVKRIGLMPGDSYQQVRAPRGWLDLIEVHPRTDRKSTRNVYRTVEVPPENVYVVGDNLGVSYDSRNFGCIPIASIESKLVDQRSNRAQGNQF